MKKTAQQMHTVPCCRGGRFDSYKCQKQGFTL